MTRRLPLVAVLLLAAAGCPGYTHLPGPDRALVHEALVGQHRQLTVSMYVGPFFRDDRYRLLVDQPPGSVDLLRDPRSETISAGRPTGILPAGTSLLIDDVQFPTAAVATSRSLLTPRYFTWVLLEKDGEPRPLVLVLRDDPKTHQAFEALLERYLTEKDVAGEVAGFPAPIRDAIAHKTLVTGMTADQARMAWGLPLSIRRDQVGDRVTEHWRFEGGRTLTIQDGKLTTWADAPAHPAGARSPSR